jgi:anti-sigma regulatory factor (Ser/Thr protein kinase)
MAAEITLTGTSAHAQALAAPAGEQPPHSPRRVNPAAVMAAVIGDPGTMHTCLELSSEPRAVSQARRFVADKLHEWGCTSLAESAELICSELTTNAVVHGRTRPKEEDEKIVLVLTWQPGVALIIQMADNSTAPPVPRVTGPGAVSGRGLRLVTTLSNAWTSWLNGDGSGKKVWVYLCCPQSTMRQIR